MMLEDAKPKLLIATEEQLARFSDIPWLESLCYDLAAASRRCCSVGAISTQSYGLYHFTSGSTGRPKGVMVGQTAIVNRLLWMQNHYPLTADDVVAQKRHAVLTSRYGSFLVVLLPGQNWSWQNLKRTAIRWQCSSSLPVMG